MKITVRKDLPRLRAAAVAKVAALAAANRTLYATPGKDGVYSAKLAEANRWFQDGQPADLSDYPYIEAETGVTAPTAYELALLWLNLQTLWVNQLAPQIERREQLAKAAIAAAASPAAIDAVIAGWIDV